MPMSHKRSRSELHHAVLPWLVAVALCVATSSGCGERYVRTHGQPDLQRNEVATLRTEYEFGKELHVEWLDGVPVVFRPAFSSQEFELRSGLHIVKVGFREGNWSSIEGAIVAFEARKGGRYEVQGARIKQGFWTEFQRAAAMYAESSWVPWIVDLDSNEVVAGVRVEEAHFETNLENVDYPKDRFSITVEELQP